jgi:hypothetical protein
MPTVHASPTDGRPTHDIVLGLGGQKWGLMLDKNQNIYSVDERTTESSFSAIFTKAGTKTAYGDDPILTMLEQRDWSTGRGVKNYEDDPNGYLDACRAWTLTKGKVLPVPQFKYATGIRNANIFQPDSSFAWKSLAYIYGIGAKFTATAYTAAHVKVWVRRVGNPGTLSMSLYSDTGGVPGTLLATVTKTTDDITDVTSQIVDFGVTQALTGAAIYHAVVSGASLDNLTNHWEVGVDDTLGGSLEKSNGVDWNVATYKMFYYVTDANSTQRGYYFMFNSILFYVSAPTVAPSVLYAFDGTVFNIQAISSTALTDIVTGQPVVSGKYVYFPQGENTAILHMSKTYVGTADGTNMATFLAKGNDATTGDPIILKANFVQDTTCSVTAAPSVTSGNLSFGTAIKCGSAATPINGIMVGTAGLYVFRSDGFGIVTTKYTAFKSDIAQTPSLRNGQSSAEWNQVVYFSWLNTIMRQYGTNTEDIGQSWAGNGKPSERQGSYSCIVPTPAWLLCAMDAGENGVSSLDVYNGLSWTELYRTEGTGHRIRNIFWQPNETGRDRIWIEQGDDLVYIDMPLDVASPIYDTGLKYGHEFSVVLPTFDNGAARLPKYIRSLAASSTNLNGSTIRIEIDYQKDDDINTSTWKYAGSLLNSPEDEILTYLGNVRAIRFRIRVLTSDLTVPPIIDAIVAEGFTRTPNRTTWNIRIKVGGKNRLGNTDANASDLLAWLRRCSQYPGEVVMESVFPELHNRRVIISPPIVQRTGLNKQLHIWKGTFTLSIMDIT